MPRINQLPAASSVAQTDVLAIDTTDKTYKVPRSVLAPAPYIATIPTGQWSGSGSDRYITVTASNVTADAMLYPFYDNASAALLNGPVWVIPAAGSFTIHTSAIPSGTVTISVLLAGIVGEAQYQVLADVYSKSQVDSIVSQSTAWSNNWLTNTSILAYAASVANPSFTTFRTSATSTDVPIANEYYIGTVERYGQNITVKMTTMQDASKMYINNSVNGGSTWTGWKTFLDSQSTAKTVDSGVLATYTYGTLRYRLLTNFGVAQIIWSGNANIPDETVVNVTLPDKLKPAYNSYAVMRNGDMMEVRNETAAGVSRLTFGAAPKAWSTASITYIP